MSDGIETVPFLVKCPCCGNGVSCVYGRQMVACAECTKANWTKAVARLAQERYAALARCREADWQDIATAPKDGFIVVGWKDGSRWRFSQVHNEHDDWIDVHSDRIVKPLVWRPLPAPPVGEPGETK